MKTEEWIHRYNNAFAQAGFEQEFWDRRLAPKAPKICVCGDEMGRGVCLGARHVSCKEMPEPKVPPELIPPGYVEMGHGLRFDFPPISLVDSFKKTLADNEIRDNPYKTL